VSGRSLGPIISAFFGQLFIAVLGEKQQPLTALHQGSGITPSGQRPSPDLSISAMKTCVGSIAITPVANVGVDQDKFSLDSS
jgi:hypothetical protein